MSKMISSWAEKIISLSFYLIFFLVPLAVTPFNFELFEYNKMMLTYGLALLIGTMWVIKMITDKQILIRRSPFDIPLLLFLASQIISTIVSIDRHVSLFGYYSRFNGGLLSVVTYITLFYAFISNIKKEDIKKYLFTALISAVFICIYAVLQRLGIDKHIWIQDVQNRVFSTLGQPNWLAALLAILLPVSIGFSLSDTKFQKKIKFRELFTPMFIALILTAILLYISLIFTKSRSGFLGFWITNSVFWVVLLCIFKKNILKVLVTVNIAFLIVNFLFATPFEQINKFTLPSLIKESTNQENTQPDKPKAPPSPVLETGVTESGDIRRIVWQGAVDITKEHPLFGTGTETFAFAYYRYRPAEHNMTSEWDFLYNKAHNEYLNYAATTGLFGLGTYIVFIFTVIIWTVKQIVLTVKKHENTYDIVLPFALITGWVTILITNFLGFSVVVVQLYFFLIPGMLLVLIAQKVQAISISLEKVFPQKDSLMTRQWVLIGIVLIMSLFFQMRLIMAYMADIAYAKGSQESKAGQYLDAYESLRQALSLNSREVAYYDELSIPASALSLAAHNQNEATLASELKTQAIAASNLALTQSPGNVSFYKTRARMFYDLAEQDKKYLKDAIQSLKVAFALSPTDPKVAYNIGLMYGKAGDNKKALEYLEKAGELKPNYREVYIALALYYIDDKNPEKARDALNHILKKINPGDSDANKILEQIESQ